MQRWRKWLSRGLLTRTNAFLLLKRGAYLQGSLHFMPHSLAFRLDLIKKAVASLSPISSFHVASVPDSLCEARPLVEAEARGGNDRGEARWTDASCWRRLFSASARPSHVLRRLLGVSRATDVSEGDAGGLSEASRSEGRHECANGRARHTCFCPLLRTGTRAKIGSEQILQLSRGRGYRENANLESTLSRRENLTIS